MGSISSQIYTAFITKGELVTAWVLHGAVLPRQAGGTRLSEAPGTFEVSLGLESDAGVVVTPTQPFNSNSQLVEGAGELVFWIT